MVEGQSDRFSDCVVPGAPDRRRLDARGLGAQTVDLGFNPQNAIEITFDLRLQGYDNSRGEAFQKTLLERVRGLPGVTAAGVADMVPVDLHFSRSAVFIEGRTQERTAKVPGHVESGDSRVFCCDEYAAFEG